MIGFVESVNKETANFLTIKVKLATDFKRISDVYIIANTRKEEQQALEQALAGTYGSDNVIVQDTSTTSK